jgi:Ca-activated chloride channel homolog
MYFLRFANFGSLYFFVPFFLLLIIYKLKFCKKYFYKYPLTGFLKNNQLINNSIHKKILYFIRFLIFILLLFLIARPQWVDSKSKVNIEGIDIILTLDVSGSMQSFDDLNDRRSRIEVLRTEATRFVDKRINDPIGIVIFAADVITLCPLTIDKKILKDTIANLQIGFINEKYTFLGTGLATAVSRLRSSKAKSKIIVLLTDGIPTIGERVDPKKAIELAKQFGIKVYTIGIGRQDIDEDLLQEIAKTTGGRFFRAHNPAQMSDVYNQIDKLERTEQETNIFHNYYEIFTSLIWILLLLIGLEIVLRTVIWRGLYS